LGGAGPLRQLGLGQPLSTPHGPDDRRCVHVASISDRLYDSGRT
jgi:hypothetical protein